MLLMKKKDKGFWIFAFQLAMVVVINATKDDNCRIARHMKPIKNKILTGHVIKNITVYDQGNGLPLEMTCQALCYNNPDCVSTNFDTTPEATPNCQLSNSTSKDTIDLTHMPGMIYQAFENHCAGSPCPSSTMTCQSGYGTLGYRCLCPKCFHGNQCKKFKNDTVLVFPQKDTSQRVVYENFFSSALTAFTITMWVKFNRTDGEMAVFSYATNTTSANEILVKSGGGDYLNIFMKGIKRHSFFGLDTKWHHYAITWTSRGNIVLYKDGRLNAVGLDDGIESSDAEGALVLGQMQTSYLGGYDLTKSFKGSLASVNMWNSEMTASEIEEHAKTCPPEEGNLFAWSGLSFHNRDNVEYFCGKSDFCSS